MLSAYFIEFFPEKILKKKFGTSITYISNTNRCLHQSSQELSLINLWSQHICSVLSVQLRRLWKEHAYVSRYGFAGNVKRLTTGSRWTLTPDGRPLLHADFTIAAFDFSAPVLLCIKKYIVSVNLCLCRSISLLQLPGANPGFPIWGGVNFQGGGANLLFNQFFPWKWKKLDREGAHVPGAPLGCATDFICWSLRDIFLHEDKY